MNSTFGTTTSKGKSAMDLYSTAKQLPLLPGNSFDDPLLKENHSKRHVFDYKGGQIVVKDFFVPDDVMNMTQVSTAAQKLATLKFQQEQEIAAESEEQPKWLSLDRKVLRFYCYFKEAVHESNAENFRIRKCVLYYYLEDDTIYVSEPKQDNSAIPQGALVKRHRIPKPDVKNEFYTLESFNVGEEIEMYGKTFRIVDCDTFTKEFLGNIGITVRDPEPYPDDQYTTLRSEIKKNMNPHNHLKPEDQHLKRYLEYSFKGRHTNPSKQEQAEIQQFLKKDRQVLRFYCSWDDRKTLYGDLRYFVLEYYLADDKIKISETYSQNCGRDPFPVFIKKQKVPKPSIPGQKIEYYTEKDLGIGKTIEAFSKSFLLYDCDEYTKEYYQIKYGIQDFTPIDVKLQKQKPIKMEPPPYNGYGTEEDSLGSWYYLVMKPPKKDIKKFMTHDKDKLRFGAVMDTKQPEDIDRKFIITFYLADDTVSIFEPPLRNSGIIGGKFLQRQRVKSPSGEYYKMENFHVGATLTLHGHKFILNQTDEHTVKTLKTMSIRHDQSLK